MTNSISMRVEVRRIQRLAQTALPLVRRLGRVGKVWLLRRLLEVECADVAHLVLTEHQRQKAEVRR
jgi:hypothetical protein